ncbi:MAG TPA: DUF2017 family protein [Jatrophihabitantaceae bacterium]|jgi:hypothetical protein|nr:DUF2017 family protein [Jatrophihabitantaceae bacterium]
MRVTRRRGVLKLSLEPFEVELLNTLLDELDDVVTRLPADDPATGRLFPDGYRDDGQAAREFRGLTQDTLRDTRLDRCGQLRALLPAGGGAIVLAEPDSTLWITVLNDLRLAIGTRLGVSEDESHVPVAGETEAASWAVYQWLSVLQDSLVHAIMG